MDSLFADAAAWAGWIGGILGGALGVIGAGIGTYCSLKNVQGPRERAFVVRASAAVWIFVAAFVAGLLLIPTWHRHLLWIPYAILLAVGVRAWNKRQARIRAEEAGDAL